MTVAVSGNGLQEQQEKKKHNREQVRTRGCCNAAFLFPRIWVQEKVASGFPGTLQSSVNVGGPGSRSHSERSERGLHAGQVLAAENDAF